jgi:ParB family chromosome partitioning protein
MIDNIEREPVEHPVFPLRVTERYDQPEPVAVATEHAETSVAGELGITMIPIGSIKIPNPRDRNKKKFREIVTNIGEVGLKKPITVRPRPDGKYDLVCGQGRLEAFTLLGQTTVPAIIRNVSEEEAMVMSLVENIARRRPTTMETIRGLVELRERGYSQNEIGAKTGIAANHVGELLYLYDHGEERLLAAVETGKVSLTAALIISRSDNQDVQNALAQAVEQKKFTQAELQRARDLADARKVYGKNRLHLGKYSAKPAVTSESIVRAFRREQDKQRQALKKAELCEARLTFVTSAMKALLHDDNFVNLLRAEGLETVPEYLADEMKKGESND